MEGWKKIEGRKYGGITRVTEEPVQLDYPDDEKIEESLKDPSKRRFLRGALATAIAAGATATLKPWEGDDVSEASDDAAELSDNAVETHKQKVEQVLERHPSIHFRQAVEKYKKDAQKRASERGLLRQFNQIEEERLVERIRSGEVRSTIDVAEHFGNKPVVGADEYNRIEYVEQQIQFSDAVPKNVQAELRKIMPGLCAQESRFDNNAKSGVGARGIFQFMPETWKEIQEHCKKDDEANGVANPTPLNINSLRDQTRAAGVHFSNIYKRLQHFTGDELVHIQKLFFPNGSFEKYFLVPLMINSYNAGSKRLSDAVVLLASEFKSRREAEQKFGRDVHTLGHDLFFELSEMADESNNGSLRKYGKHASEYVPRIYANNELIHERKQFYMSSKSN